MLRLHLILQYSSLLLLLCWSSFNCIAQCAFTIEGTLKDEVSGAPLSGATVYVRELSAGVVTDQQGKFAIEQLCAQTYHLNFSHLGCAEKQMTIELKSSKLLSVFLHHHAADLQEVIVEDHAHELDATVGEQIAPSLILEHKGAQLSELLSTTSGVQVLQNGKGISKPIVHGLTNDRLVVVQQGVPLSTQSWGSDHGIEVDGSMLNQVKVLKGASALRYGPEALAGAIVTAYSKIQDAHLHGSVTNGFHSNGRGLFSSFKLEQKRNAFAYRIFSGYKNFGDFNTPEYYLTNSGYRNFSGGLQLQKNLNRHFFELYTSVLSSENGVLKASQIGNLTDLQLAIQREEPYFATQEFSRLIDPAHQAATHSIFKFKHQYTLSDYSKLTQSYAFQINNRKEFDNRRGAFRYVPALDLRKWSHFYELVYQKESIHDRQFETGLQFVFQDNTNVPGTATLPLLPDFRLLRPAYFIGFKKQKDKLLFALGGRYDFNLLNAWPIRRGIVNVVEQTTHINHNVVLSGSLQAATSKATRLRVNLDVISRAAKMHELYSDGLHQGVASYEQGNEQLDSEQSMKLSAEFKIFGHKASLKVIPYVHLINNFIYLQAQDSFLLTVRGAYPLFIYESNDAIIRGVDLDFKYQLSNAINARMMFDYLKGDNLELDMPLVQMPGARLRYSLEYAPQKKIGFLQHTRLSLQCNHQFKQHYLNADQDFIAPPEGYTLVNAKLSTHLINTKQQLILNVQVQNIFDITYRSYLNRLRYFADEPGRSVNVQLSYVF